MSDRELLERAAKAAGIRLEWDGPPDEWCPMYYEGKTYHAWNPLTDYGDAFRLAVKLNMFVDVQQGASGAQIVGVKFCSEPNSPDPYAATRRAIVRAAAALAGDAP